MPEHTDVPPPEADDSNAVDDDRAARAATTKSLGNTMAFIGIVVVLAIGTFALTQMDRWGAGGNDGAGRFQLDLSAQMDVPADLLTYTEQGRLTTSLQIPTAIAVGPEGEIYLAGDQAIEILLSDGTSRTVDLDGVPTCLAVSGPQTKQPGRLYVGVQGRVVVLDATGEPVQQWAQADASSILTGIAAAEDHVFVADAGQRIVLHYDTDGKYLGTLGGTDPDPDVPAFIIPSPYFDLAVGADETLYVVNPGMRRVEAYGFDGQLQSYWGEAGSELPKFFGCCNPAHVTLLSDGRFVTSEKGIPRIKIYSRDGDFQEVVAGPRQLGVSASALGDARGNQKERVFDVAIDDAGNVLVLDAHRRQVIRFESRKQESESDA